MKTSQQIWDHRYGNHPSREPGNHDRWLEKWKESIQERRGHALDLGCGRGWDSRFLLESGYTVTGLDFSSEVIQHCKKKIPEVDFRIGDFSQGLDFPSDSFSAVIASLSLHYFEKEDTVRIIQDVSRVLKRKGLFAFRVNSIGDTNFGYKEKASLWDTVLVEGVLKQHFNKEMIEELLLDQFNIEQLEYTETNRYGKTKRLYECLSFKA